MIFWVWIIGPVIGAITAAILYNQVLLPHSKASEIHEGYHPQAKGSGETQNRATPQQ